MAQDLFMAGGGKAMKTCPKCGGSLFFEREVDGVTAILCINGHRFEPRPKPEKALVPVQISYEEERAEQKANRIARDGEIVELLESGVPRAKVAREYKLKKSSIETIYYNYLKELPGHER
jgi:hypothetical protein